MAARLDRHLGSDVSFEPFYELAFLCLLRGEWQPDFLKGWLSSAWMILLRPKLILVPYRITAVRIYFYNLNGVNQIPALKQISRSECRFWQMFLKAVKDLSWLKDHLALRDFLNFLLRGSLRLFYLRNGYRKHWSWNFGKRPTSIFVFTSDWLQLRRLRAVLCHMYGVPTESSGPYLQDNTVKHRSVVAYKL